MDNTKLSSDYHFASSRNLAGMILLFYGISAGVAVYTFTAIAYFHFSLSYFIILILAFDATRLYRRYAGLVGRRAVVRVLYSSRERICYLYSKTGAIQPAQVIGVLSCLPGVSKVDFQLLENRKRRCLFIASDQLSSSAYHQFRLRMEEVGKMFKN